MLIQLLLIVLALAVPLVAAYALVRRDPSMGAFKASGISAACFGVIYLVFIFALRSATDNAAPFWLAAVLVFGTIAGLVGFGMGMAGHSIGVGRNRKDAAKTAATETGEGTSE